MLQQITEKQRNSLKIAAPGAHLDDLLVAITQAINFIPSREAILLGWVYSNSFRLVDDDETYERNEDGLLLSASVEWPDGASGVWTTDEVSTDGAINAYHVTHVLAGVTLTFTQPTVERDETGAVKYQPPIIVS